MTLEELKNKADKDLKIDVESLDRKSIELPYITGSWLKELNKQVLHLRKITVEHDKLSGQKFHFYKNEYTVLIKSASDVQQYIKADDEFVKSKLRLQNQEETVEYIESVVKELNSMSFNISNAIKWQMFKSGGA